MKRIIIAISAVFLLLLAHPKVGFALDIDLGDLHVLTGNEPPPLEMTGPPEFLPIPGRYVYFVPDLNVDIFYYHGMWYRPYKGRWFTSDRYDGRWKHVRDVPPALTDLPPDYRSSPPRFDRIPYGELRNNWERWEQEKYWDRRRIELPPIKISGPLELLPIPGRYVYFIPDIDADIFFYHGMWYRPYRGRWFTSDRYDGRWDFIRDVPPALVDLDYRSNALRFDRIPYGKLRNSWERWEQEKYWNREKIRERHGYRKGEEDLDERMERHPEGRESDRY